MNVCNNSLQLFFINLLSQQPGGQQQKRHKYTANRTHRKKEYQKIY
jgi:hypothetical protein